MKLTIFTLLMYFLFISCNSNKQYIKISYKKIQSIEVAVGQYCDYYKRNKLNGIYKIKGELGEYSLAHYKKGFRHGEFRYYDRGQLIKIENYKDGLWHGDRIYYSGGLKSIKITYKNGFANGSVIWYNENIKNDTLLVNYHKADSLKMDVYIDKKSSYIIDQPLDMFVDFCLIKVDEYPIRYFLKKDSSIVTKKKWHKIANCVYQSKEWGCSGAD